MVRWDYNVSGFATASYITFRLVSDTRGTTLPLVPSLLRTWSPVCLSHSLIIQLYNCHNLICNCTRIYNFMICREVNKNISTIYLCCNSNTVFYYFTYTDLLLHLFYSNYMRTGTTIVTFTIHCTNNACHY